VDVTALLQGDVEGGRIAAAASNAEPTLLNDNGGWTWFSDERAVVDPARCALLVTSVADADAEGSGGDERDGDIEVVAFELTTSRMFRSALSTGTTGDDQNSAALHVRADGRYVAMYALHDADTLTRWRVSRRPGDTTEWEPEQTVDNGAPTSYSNVYAVPGEGRLYAFVRSAERDPHFLTSNDDGSSWSAGGRLLASPGDPYVRYVSDGAGRIHLISTDGHPRDEYRATGVYHGIIEQGRLLRSDGSVADPDLFDEEAAQVDSLTRVFAAEGVRVQVIDIELDAVGNPQVVFSTRQPSLIAAENLRTYQFARFDGSAWHVHPMAEAGNALSASQPDDTGLAAIVPRQSSRVFVSTDVDPASGMPLISNSDRQQHFELFEGVTTDGGSTWSWSPLTSNSTADNVRPIALRKSSGTSVLWLRGTYTDGRTYDLDVVGRLANGCMPSTETP
jgi:hypothetical protein